MYRFPPNEINLKSLSLILTGSQLYYDMEVDTRDATKFGRRLTGPIGLDGLYRKGELTYHGFNDRFEGLPRVSVVKGTWKDDYTFVIDRLILGQGPAEQWTLTFDGENLNVVVDGRVFADGKTGG